MTVKELVESLGLQPMYHVLIKGYMSARMPGLWESEIGLQIDEAAGVMKLNVNNKAEWVKTFRELEKFVNEKPNLQRADDVAAAGPAAEPLGISGQDHN